MDKIDKEGFYRPTTAQVLSSVDLALQYLNDNNKYYKYYCSDILDRFKEDYLWTATESLSFPKGVLVYDNIDGEMPETSKGLLKLLNAKDERVRLVQPGFKTGYMPISEFLKNPYVIAQIGKDKIKIAESVAKSIYKKYAYVKGFDKAHSDTKRFTSISFRSYGPDPNDGGMCLNGDFSDSVNGGYASGSRRK